MNIRQGITIGFVSMLLMAAIMSARPAFAQSGVRVCLYSEANYSGNEYCSTSNISFVAPYFTTASVKVPEGYNVTLYRLPFHVGAIKELRASSANFTDFGGNVRSLTITKSKSNITAAALVPVIDLLLGEEIDPNDFDGDGYPNDLEEEYGTNPRDPNSTPPDIDGDKIPDDIDDDRDGDGIPNDIETDRETDPDDASDYPDLVAPALTVNNPLVITTTENALTVTGSVIDFEQPYSGLEGLFIQSSQYEGTQFTGTLNDTDGSFSIEVPLKLGENVLSVTALDKSANRTVVELQVRRNSVPMLESISPADGTITTQDTATITGTIRTTLPAEQFIFVINGSTVATTSTQQSDVYEFSFIDVPLTIGDNDFRFEVSSSIGGDVETVVIQYQPEAANDLDPPSITQFTPSDGSTLNQQSFRVGAQIESFAGPLTVRVNDEVVIDASDETTFYSLNQVVSFPDGNSTTTITIEAEDSLGKLSQQSLTYYRDATKPLIVFDQAYQPLPTVTSVDRSPVRFSGTVSDPNLTSLLVNSQAVTLQAGGADGSYRFEIDVPLLADQATPINFTAFDRSGNAESVEFSLINDAPSSIKALLPPEDTVFIASGESLTVQAVARLQGQSDSDQVVAYLSSAGSATVVPLVITGTLASADIQLPSSSGEQTIVFELRNEQGQRITSDENTVRIAQSSDVPLEVVRIEPENTAEFIEPNTPIEIYFNRSVDLADLSVTVRETLNGKSYLNADALGEDFIRAQGYVLNDVNRNLESVPGQLNTIPGNAGVVFAASRYYGYNADVFVEVSHQGQQLARTRFKVRELPTFINGAVVDQFGQPLRGIKVEIPELKRSTTTNGDGGFAFGYQESGEKVIDGGSYSIVLNQGFANPSFGTINTLINVQRNQRNELPRYTLQELDESTPFYNLSSGTVNNLLGGDLILDLSDARAVFPNQRTSGPVHAQFLPYEHLGVNSFQFSIPHWLFGVQPKGIALEGEAAIDIKIPKLRGGYEYIDPDTYQYVVLLGYSDLGKVVEPVGVGVINNLRVTSVGKLHLSSLDFLGYALVLPSLTNELDSYAKGQISLQQLKAALQTQGQ